MNQNERKTVLHRMLLLIAVACVIMGLYAMRLIFLQLVNGDDFKQTSGTPALWMVVTRLPQCSQI